MSEKRAKLTRRKIILAKAMMKNTGASNSEIFEGIRLMHPEIKAKTIRKYVIV